MTSQAPSLQALLRKAFELHHQRRFGEAISLYRAVLAKDAANFDAL